MEVGKGQPRETFPGSSLCDDFTDEDDDDGHFVIALDDSGQDDDELDGCDGRNPENIQSLKSDINPGVGSSEPRNQVHLIGRKNDNLSVTPTGKTEIETIEIDSCDSSPEILHLECTTEDVGPEISIGPSEELKEEAPLNPGLLKETNKLPEFIRSCPDIIRQLKSSLIDHSVVSEKESNKLSPQSTSNCRQAAIFSSNNEGKCTDQTKKFEFTPRDDCTCIMCNGWTASKFVSEIPEHGSSLNHKLAPFDQEFLANKGTFSCTTNSIQSERRAEDVGLGTSSHMLSNNHQSQENNGSDLSSQNTSPEPSLKLKDRLKNHVLAGQKQLHSLHSNQSSCVERVNICENYVLRPEGKKSQVAVAKSLFSNRYVLIDKPGVSKTVSPVFCSNGTYYKLLPQSTVSSSCMPTLTKAPGIPLGPKLLPKVNKKERKGQNLVLTREFVSSFQPTLKSILNKASKVDLSDPEKVCIDFSEDNPTTKSHKPTELSSNTRLLIQHTGSAHSAVCSLTTDVGYSLPASGMGDVLLGLVNTHLKVKSVQNENATNLGGISASLNKIPSVCLASRSHFNSSTFSSSSNLTHLVLSSQKNSPILQPMKISPKISQPQTLPLSSLPPPPPLLRCPTAPVSVKVTSLAGKQNNDSSAVDEPTETLVIPIPKDPPSKHANQTNSSVNVDVGENWSSDLYTFSAPLDTSPVKAQCEILNEIKKEYVHVSSEFIPTQKEPQQSTLMKLLSPPEAVKVNDLSNSSSAQFVPVSSTSLNISNLEELSHQDHRTDNTDPPVIRVNLSSCASFTCPINTISVSPHIKILNPASQLNFKPLIKSSALSSNSDAAVINSCLQEQVVISAPVSVSDHSAPFLTKSSSSSASSYHANTVNKHLPSKQSFQGNLSGPFCSLPNHTLDTIAKANCLERVSPTTMASSSSKVATTKSASAFIPITCPLQISKVSLPSTTFSSSSLTLSSSSTSLSSSSSSVSVSGLKLKIRLGDVKGNGQEEVAGSENCGQSSNTPGTNVEVVSVDSSKQINQDHSTDSKRSETAEEMFQRFQEQAMQQVYNAQFGVGDLSRSLRPTRCNISFVDKSIPHFLIDEGKKKKLPEEKVDSTPSVQQPASLSKKKKPSEESINGLASLGIVLSKPAGSENVAKGKKKRQSSNESNCDIPRKEPKFDNDINSYPKFQQDNSILIKKTIDTPNIMAGHKVFVKFNVFSNPQSGRSFLAPFFNLGGSRVQFDVEDMEYIKKSVVEIEKEDKTCARHLLYYSRESKKATFLRKENLAHMSELNDKSYKKCSYILQGFSREPTKKIVPLPEEWKLDKKVSIEIDTADTDNNITIDFGSCHDIPVLPEENGIVEPEMLVNSKGQGDIKRDDCIAENHSKVDKFITKTGAGGICLNSNRAEGEHGVDTCDNPRKNVFNVSGQCEKQIHTKPVVHTSTPVMASDSIRTVGKSSCNVKSSFRPNILRKKISTSPLRPSLKNSSRLFSPEVSLAQSSRVSEASYTDQLKELFVSGSLQRTLPPVSMTPCLEELGHNTNDEKELAVKLKPESSKSSCSNSLNVLIKNEKIDHEYEQSKSPLVEKSKESRKSEEESLSKSNVDIKPEPIDDYFDSLERNSQANVVTLTPQVEKSAENNLDNIPTDQTISSRKPNEIMSSSTDQGLGEENNTEESSNTALFENDDDEDSLSAISDSYVHSSSVSESSEITPSSCIDTSDELQDESDTYLDSELTSSSTMSFTSDVPESSQLNSENVAPNPIKTKITSLVESLKQRLKENSAVSSVLPVKQPKVKLRKKKFTKKRTIMTEQPIPNNCNGSNDISIASKTDITSVVMHPVRSAFADTTTSPSITCNTTSIAQDKSFTSPMSDLSSIVNSPSTLCPSVSSSICSLSENTPNNSVNPVPITSTVPRLQTQSPSGSAESDVSKFKKLFPFITSVPLAKQDSNSKERNLLSKNVVKVKAVHDSEPCEVQSEEEELVLIDDVKENHTPKEIGVSLSISSLVSEPLSNSKVTDTESMRSTPCSDIDVGTESDIDVGTECVPEISIFKSIHPKLPFSSPPLPANGRNLRDFTRENEFLMSKEDCFQSKKDPKQRPQNGNKGTSNVSPSKFTLPLRIRTKSYKRKAEPPKVVSKPSVASILCQKLDIAVEPIVPKLKRKVIMPLELEGYVDGGKDQSQSIAHTEIDQPVSKISSPKPINPTFKPSINAIFGVENIPTSVDSLINKQNPEKPSITEEPLNKTNRGKPKRETAKKGTVSKFKKNSQKQPDTHVEIEDKKKIEDETKSSDTDLKDDKKYTDLKDDKKSSDADLKDDKKSSDTDLKDDKKSVLPTIHRYRSLRKMAWRKCPKLPDSDGNTDESFSVLENTKSDTDVDSVKSDDVKKEVAIKQCVLLLCKLEDMNWGSEGGPVMISPGSYLVKDAEEQDKQHENSEISRKRKKKSVLKRSKKSKAIRPKKDIVDYYAAAIESLRRKALLLEENEKKEAEKQAMESKVIVKVKVDESSDLNSKDNEWNEEINVHQDEECEFEISQLQIGASKSSLLSENGEKDKVVEDAPGGSHNNEMTCSFSRNDVRTPMLAIQTPKTLANEMISEHIIYDNDTTTSSNSQPENKSVDNSGNDDVVKLGDSPLHIVNNQGDNTLVETIHLNLKSAGSSAEIVQNSSLTHCRMSKGNRKNVHIAERNFEGDHIKVFNTFFQDQDDLEESMDDWMEDSEDEDKSALVEEDKETTVNESPERKDGEGRGPINIIERNYEGEFIKAIWIKSQVQNEDISDTVMGVCEEQDECSLAESERDTASDESEIDISLNGLEEEISLYKVIENANKTIAEVRDCVSDVGKKDLESEECHVFHNVENMSSKPYTSDQTSKNDKLQSTEPLQVESVALTEASTSADISSGIFTNKDIVLGFEDELGADTVLSKLGSADADDMFLLDVGDETENIGLIPDDEVERLLGLDLKSGESDPSLEEENKIADGNNESNKSKLNWKMISETDSKKGKEHQNQTENETSEELKSSDSNKPVCNSEEDKNEGCSSDKDLVEMTDKIKSPNSSQDIDSNDRSMSPERITGNGDTKTASISPSWKRILGSQALKEIQESVTSAIASASSKQESANIQKLGEQKNLILKNDKLKLKLCTGALSKAFKLSVEMRKSLKDSPTESNSEKEMKTKNEVGLDRQINVCKQISFSSTTASMPVDKVNKSVLIDENMESNRIDFPKEVRKKEAQSGNIKQTSSLMEMDDDIVIYKAGNDKSNDRRDFTGKTSITSGFDDNDIQISEDCIPTESNKSGIFSEAERLSEIDRKKTPDSLIKSASTKNIIKAFGNKTIDLTKLKMKLNPLLALGKSKSVPKDITGKQVNDKDSTSTLFSSGSLLTQQSLSAAKNTTFGAHSKEQPLVTETSLHSATTKQVIVAPQINKEKLSNILKNFKKPLALKLNPGNSSKDLLLSNSPEKGKNSSSSEENNAGRMSSLRKRKRSPKQTEDVKHTESKRSKMFTVNKKQEQHSGINLKFNGENSETDDKGERSCFDCLSGITPDLWNSK